MKIHHEINDLSMLFRPDFTCNYLEENFHWHENIEFLYILSDGFKILIDGIQYEPQKGDLIFIGEYSVHCFICENKCINMSLGQFSVSLLLDGHTELKPIKPHITAEDIAKDPVFERQLMHLIELMKSIGSVTQKEKNLFAKGVFSTFYYALMERFPNDNISDNFKKERKDFYRIIEFINENISDDITVLSIAKSLYIDRGKLSRIFSKYSGMSINDYINKLRISKANELLENGLSVTEAAFESGFQSVRTFNNVYKSLMGTTPSKYTNKKGRNI
jgi:AraC-like DNA-binding protein